MPTITNAEFKTMLGKPGNKILTIKASTIPYMRKTGNPYYGRVRKVTTANGSIGANYQDSVNRVLEKHGYPGDFVSGERQWGEKVDNTFTTNKDGTKEYINFQQKSSQVEWLLDGQPIDPAILSQWTDKDKPEKPLTIEDNPIEWAKKQVNYKNFTMTNIVSVNYNGQTWYILENFKPANERVG